MIGGSQTKKLVVKSGEAVQLTATANVRAIEVQAGGALDVEAAHTGQIKASGANVIRVCGASVSGAGKIAGTTGPVTIGDEAGCAGSTFATTLSVSGNGGDVSVIGSTIDGKLTVSSNTGAETTVAHNTIAKALTVTGNTGTVIDTPNTVGGKSKLQARKLQVRKLR